MKLTHVLLLALFLIEVVVGYFVTWPLYQRWQAVSSQKKTVEAELNDLRDKQSLIKELAAVEPALDSKRNAAALLIPENEERESFLSAIDELARNNAVTLSNFNFRGEVATRSRSSDEEESDRPARGKAASKTTPSVSFTATVSGDYIAIKNFLTGISLMKRYVTINALALSQGESLVSGTLEGKIYSASVPKIPKKLEYSSTDWNYLDERLIPKTSSEATGGRPNPFAAY